MEGLFSMMYWMFFSTTYWISTAGIEMTETKDGPSFFTKFLIRSSLDRKSK